MTDIFDMISKSPEFVKNKPDIFDTISQSQSTKKSIGATGGFAPDWKDWATGYLSSFSTGITKGFNSPEYQLENARFQEIDKQVAEPVFKKASKIAFWAYIAINGYVAIKAVPELWKLAKGALSKPLTPHQQLETAKYLRDRGFAEEAKTIRNLARKFPEIKTQLITERTVRETNLWMQAKEPVIYQGIPIPYGKQPAQETTGFFTINLKEAKLYAERLGKPGIIRVVKLSELEKLGAISDIENNPISLNRYFRFTSHAGISAHLKVPVLTEVSSGTPLNILQTKTNQAIIKTKMKIP